jgi:hypothetical protein
VTVVVLVKKKERQNSNAWKVRKSSKSPSWQVWEKSGP